MLHYFAMLVLKYARHVQRSVKNMQSMVWNIAEPVPKNAADVQWNVGLWLALTPNFQKPLPL